MNWHEKGLHSMREIQEKDRLPSRSTSRTMQEPANPRDIQAAIEQI